MRIVRGGRVGGRAIRVRVQAYFAGLREAVALNAGGEGEIDTIAMAPTRCVIPLAASLQNRYKLAEEVG